MHSPDEPEGIDDERTATRNDTGGPASGERTLDFGEPSLEIPGYRVVKLIGEGGMGRVYLAEDTALHRHIAIKLVSDSRAGDQAYARFLREARAMAAVEHPNIVQVHSYGEIQGQPYFVMQYVEGTTLARRLREHGPVPEEEALRIVAETVEALSAAWEAGIVHRDLKPANILLATDNTARVADFGLAKRTQLDGDASLTDCSHVLGTPYYLAPEQARGDPTDFRCDVYSLGIVLFEMLTGDRPFTGSTPMVIVAQHLDQPLPSVRGRRPELSADVERLVTWMTSKDPNDRPASYDELRQRLAELLGLPTATAFGTRAGSMFSIEGRHRRGARPLLSWVAAATLVAAALAAGLFWLRRPPPPLAVAVLRPVVEAEDAEAGSLAARAVREAALNTVAAIDGLTAIGPRGFDAIAGPPAAVAKAMAADEIVDAHIELDGGQYKVVLQRLRGSDGGVLWSSGVFVVDDRLRLLADTVVANLRGGYPDRGMDAAVASTKASPEDFERYLRVWQWIEDAPAGVTPDRIFDELAGIRERSPEFLLAYSAEASYARYLYQTTGSRTHLERAQATAAQAVRVNSRDPLSHITAARIQIASGDLEAAATSIDALRELDPSSPAMLDLEAGIAEARGDLDAAIEIRLRLVDRRPTYNYLHDLARTELKRGHYADARRHLEAGLARAPGSTYLLLTLAELELEHGTPVRAVAVSESLVEQQPGHVELSMLGWAHMLSGSFPDAERAFTVAAALAPEDLSLMLALAECSELQGGPEAAADSYRSALVAAESRNDLEALAVISQCSAHLGDQVRAAEAAQSLLQQAPEEVQVLYTVSLVYSLIGEPSSAIVSAERALARGYQPLWFELPWFELLHRDPRFLDALESAKNRFLINSG